MQKMLISCGLLLTCALLPGVASAQKKSPAYFGVAGGASQCDAIEGNLVANCGFEGSIAGWSQAGDPSFTDVSPDVRHSGISGLESGPTESLGFVFQTVPTTAGATYTLSFWLRNFDTPNEFQLLWDGVQIAGQVNFPDQPYTLMTYSGLGASTDLTELRFGFYNVPDFFYLDDVSVVQE